MTCEYLADNFECKTYGGKCVAYFQNEKGEEGIDNGVLEVSSCYETQDISKTVEALLE